MAEKIRVLLNLAIRLPVWFALVLLCTASAAGFFGQMGHFVELTSHFRLLYALGFVICFVILAVLHSWRMLALGVLFFIANVIPIAALYVPQLAHTSLPGTAQVSILQINTWGPKNPHHDSVLRLIRQTSPDVVGVTELTDTWVVHLEKGLSDYPYRFIEKRFGGVALFSRYPLLDGEVLYTGKIKRPRIRADLDLNGTRITLIFAHTVTPRWQHELRNAELNTLASEARAAKGPVIVFGDLNCSPWSYYFWRLEQRGHLRDTERGFGLQPTWSTHWYFPWVPIDHCLTSNEFVTVERKVGPKIGSDHLPVFVRLELRARPAKLAVPTAFQGKMKSLLLDG